MRKLNSLMTILVALTTEKKDEDKAQNIEETEPQSPKESKENSKEGSPQKDMQDDSQSIHEETQNSGKDDEGSNKGKEKIEHVLVSSPRQGAMLSSPKVIKPWTSRKRVPQTITPNVTRAL